MNSPYVTVDRGKDLVGHRWEVGVRGPGMTVSTAGPVSPSHMLCLDGELLDQFAEAVARAQQLAEAHAAQAGDGHE